MSMVAVVPEQVMLILVRSRQVPPIAEKHMLSVPPFMQAPVGQLWPDMSWLQVPNWMV